MKYSNEKPPVYDECHRRFGVEWDKGLIIAYGDTVYAKNLPIPPQKEVHEATHIKQQNGQPDQWWDKYFTDKAFRLSQEVEAYRNEISFVKRYCKDKNKVTRIIHQLRVTLATMYDCVDFNEACKLLK